MLDYQISVHQEYKLIMDSLFVVHHALLNQENFDRIIRINKEVFTNIEEIEFENV